MVEVRRPEVTAVLCRPVYQVLRLEAVKGKRTFLVGLGAITVIAERRTKVVAVGGRAPAKLASTKGAVQRLRQRRRERMKSYRLATAVGQRVMGCGLEHVGAVRVATGRGQRPAVVAHKNWEGGACAAADGRPAAVSAAEAAATSGGNPVIDPGRLAVTQRGEAGAAKRKAERVSR